MQKGLTRIDYFFHLNIARIRGSKKAIASSAVKYICCDVPVVDESVIKGICLGSCVFILTIDFYFRQQRYNFFST